MITNDNVIRLQAKQLNTTGTKKFFNMAIEQENKIKEKFQSKNILCN